MHIYLDERDDGRGVLAEVAAVVGDAACVEAEAEAFARAVQAMLAGEEDFPGWTDEAAEFAMDIVEEPAAVAREAEAIVVGAIDLQREAETDAAAAEAAAADAGAPASAEPDSGADPTGQTDVEERMPPEPKQPAGRQAAPRRGKRAR